MGLMIVGVRTTWRTEADGEFYCAACGGDRNYQRRTGVRRLTVLNVPLVGRGTAGTVAECGTCGARYELDALEQPTTARFSAMLRDAARTVAFTVLTAGGSGADAARQAAVEVVREAGSGGCTAEELTGRLATEGLPGAGAGDDGGLAVPDDGRAAGWLSIELHEALEPLAAHLAPQGREHLLLQGARIALADGPYRPAERRALAAVGHCLGLPTEDTARLLEAAATPS